MSVPGDYDARIYSTTTTLIDGEGWKRLTWREMWEREREQRLKMTDFAVLVSDLDRCPHGRHQGDDCTFPRGGCGGPSKGNPNFQPGDIIGYGLDGAPYVVPDRQDKHNALAWGPRREVPDE